MKRIFSVLAVAALMAAVVVAMSMPAFAANYHLNPHATHPSTGLESTGSALTLTQALAILLKRMLRVEIRFTHTINKSAPAVS